MHNYDGQVSLLNYTITDI